MDGSPDNGEEVELLIEDYLDGRMTPEQRAQFEERVRNNASLKDKLNSTTKSVDLVQQALGWVTPGEEFEDRVTTRIISLTQSGQTLKPYAAAGERQLSAEDPDAKLLADPEATREKRRMVILAVIAAGLFALAACAIGYSIAKGVRRPAPPENTAPAGRR
jgi:anti-sigma factor RsiW